MSGHNKWAQIKHRKAATDAARSREFARLARMITVESKKAGGSSAAPGLAAAIARAKAANMPKDNIERAVVKGMSKDTSALDEISYEAYGPGGVAIIIEALTDNKNRTTQEIKHLLSRFSVELAAPGSANWAFMKQPDGSKKPNEPLLEIAGADEERLEQILTALDDHDDVQVVFTNARGYESTGE